MTPTSPAPVLKLLLMMAAACAAAVASTWAHAQTPTCPELPREAAATLTWPEVRQRVAACHPDVLAAEHATRGAAADVVIAGQGPNPQLTVGAGSLSRDGFGSGSLWQKTFDHQLRIDQLIERGDKPALRRAVAEAALEAARADRADAFRRALLATRLNYIDLSAALARRTETLATIALNDESARMVERRVRAGDAAALDGTRLGLEALRVKSELAQADADVHALRLQLALAIGVAARADELVPLPPAVVNDTAALAADAVSVERRPDVAAAEARVAAAEASLALARALRTRDVSVGVQFDRYPTSVNNTNGNGNSVSLSVSIPLFLRHGNEGEAARADADLHAAREALRRTRLTADTDLSRARSQWRAASDRGRLAVEQMLPAAERVAAGAELAYQRGASPVLDVLDARRSLRAARIERINADAERARAAAELEALRPTTPTLPTDRP